MNKKKILFYINTIDCGGAERVMTNLSRQFAKAGYSVIFATSYQVETEYKLPNSVTRLNIGDSSLNRTRIYKNILLLHRLRKIIKEEKPELLITFLAEPNIRGLLATMGLSTKTLISVRSIPEMEYRGAIRGLLAKLLLPRADGCVFQTKEAMKWFPKRLQKKSRVIMNPINSDYYDVVRNPQNNLIVTCGRLSEEKNYQMLIRAFSKVSNIIGDAKLFIYGKGNQEPELQMLIDELELSDKAFLKGQTNDVKVALSEADLFVLSSDYEGLPNALMEAMAVGVPCISTDCHCGGPREIIEDGINGFLIPVNEEEALVSAIINLLSDSQAKNMVSEKARDMARRFCEQEIFSEWKGYVESITE